MPRKGPRTAEQRLSILERVCRNTAEASSIRYEDCRKLEQQNLNAQTRLTTLEKAKTLLEAEIATTNKTLGRHRNAVSDLKICVDSAIKQDYEDLNHKIGVLNANFQNVQQRLADMESGHKNSLRTTQELAQMRCVIAEMCGQSTMLENKLKEIHYHLHPEDSPRQVFERCLERFQFEQTEECLTSLCNSFEALDGKKSTTATA